MIVIASSCIVLLLAAVFNTAQAFFTAPVPALVHGLSIYDVNDSKRAGSSAESNEVTMRDITEEKGDDNARDNETDEPEVRPDEQSVYVVGEFESEHTETDDKDRSRSSKDMTSDDSDNQSPLDPWSIVWYIGSFGGLVAFFLIVSCSEWCCRRGARQLNSSYVNRGSGNNGASNDSAGPGNVSTETPPPPYHLFAPPPYDSVNYVDLIDKTSGEKLDIFVITMPLQNASHQPAPA